MEVDENSYFESQTPHFFKIILPDTLQNGKLELPKSFLGKYGSVLCSSKVHLKVASGELWEMELYKENDDIWLHKGWQEFVEFYHVKFGYFLVFGYQGNSEFQVLIFDKTASEIDYPVKSSNNNKQSDGVNLNLSPIKSEMEISVSDHNACWKNGNRKTKRPREGFEDDDNENGVLRTSKSSNLDKTREKAAAIIRTRDFDSPRPYFRILMQPSHVKGRCVLHLPGRFATKHFGQRDDFYPILSLPCGRFWIVQYRFKMTRGLPVAKFQFGWNLFVEDNKLVIGDVCIFELVDSVKAQFKITIFRAAEDKNFSLFPGSGSIDPNMVQQCGQANPNPTVKLEPEECTGTQISQEPLHCHGSSAKTQIAATSNRTGKNPSDIVKLEPEECTGKQIAQEPLHFEGSKAELLNAAASNQTTENPSFKLAMTESCMKRLFVTLPKGFLKHLNNKRTQNAMLEVDDRFWQIRANYYPNSRTGSFSNGWNTFVAENSLKAGDVCKFELINLEQLVLKVSIHRGSA